MGVVRLKFVLATTVLLVIGSLAVSKTKVMADTPGQISKGAVVTTVTFKTDKVIEVPKKVVEVKVTTSNYSSSNSNSSRGYTVSSSSTGASIANYALKYLGYSYVWGATGPNAFDCSGFTYFVYRQFGISLSRTSGAQYSNGMAVSKSNLQAGDLVFFYNDIGHVGLYIGNGNFIHASTSSTGVIVSNLNSDYYLRNYAGARRIVN
ncbi:MAG: C40 family peptidase [Clostridiaceae bacterium]